MTDLGQNIHSLPLENPSCPAVLCTSCGELDMITVLSQMEATRKETIPTVLSPRSEVYNSIAQLTSISCTFLSFVHDGTLLVNVGTYQWKLGLHKGSSQVFKVRCQALVKPQIIPPVHCNQISKPLKLKGKISQNLLGVLFSWFFAGEINIQAELTLFNIYM